MATCSVAVSLTSAEQQLYLHVYAKANEVYLSLRAQGPKVVSQNLLKIMSTLLPLRRICSGGSMSYADLRVVSSIQTASSVNLHINAWGLHQFRSLRASSTASTSQPMHGVEKKHTDGGSAKQLTCVPGAAFASQLLQLSCCQMFFVMFTFGLLWYLPLGSVIDVGHAAASRTQGAAAGMQKQTEQKALPQSAQRILAASAWRAQSTSLLPPSAITGSAGELICGATCHPYLHALCSGILSQHCLSKM